MRRTFTVFLFVMAVSAAMGQTKIIGKVIEEGGKQIQSATISLLNASDSSLVKIAVSDKSGQYEFINIKEGNYFVAVSSVGFKRKISSSFQLKNAGFEIPPVSLQQNSKDLNNVTITAKKLFVETKPDKTVVNVDASPTSAGTTALEILEKSPGISVDNDGNISLRGKQGVIVMMDGKPTYLSPSDLANLLKNMPASALDQIEIMTNPSSKFDAAGNSGVVNIKTKKGKNNGFNSNLMVGATSSIYRNEGITYFMPKSQNSFNFNYRKNKLNFFGSYNPNFFRGRNTLEINSKRIDPGDGSLKGYTNQVTHFKFGNFNQTLKLGLDWYADKKNVLGVVVSGFKFNGHPTPVTVADIEDVNHQLASRLITNTTNQLSFQNFTGNFNWKHSFDTAGRELTADFDYVKYSNLSDMVLTTDLYNGSLQYSGHWDLKGHLPSNIDIYSFKSDYTKPVKNGRIEMGVKSSYVRNDNIVDYQIKNNNGDWIVDPVRSNHFVYQENINAAYLNVNRQIKKWTLQGGLRIENTNASGNQITSKSTFKRDTTNFFPTAFISYAMNEKNTITISYGKRITRPNYQDLNPFIFFLDTLSFRQGNIYLRPQYSNNVELSHSFKGKFITTMSYNNTSDVISQIIKPKEGSGGNIRYLTPDNVAKLRNMALSVTTPLTIAKWWNLNLFTTVYNNHYTGVFDTIHIDLGYTSFMINVTNSFTISKQFIAELSGFYRFKSIEQLTILEPLYQMSIGLQKQVLAGKGTLRLNIRDPFAWQKFEGLNQYGFVYMHFLARPDVRQVTATFTLRFGKSTLQQPQRKRSDSSQEEQSRVGGAG